MPRKAATGVVVRPCEGEEDLTMVKTLFTAYQLSLPIDITYQNYQDEFQNLPGKYSTINRGALFLAEQQVNDDDDDNNNKEENKSEAKVVVVGCVALRKLDETSLEMKRLYVVPQARGLSVGSRLVKAVVDETEKLSYHRILLDTLPTMSSALRLYDNFGFKRTSRYYETPIEETVFLEKRFKSSSK